MDEVIVSVIVPVYKGELTLKSALHSVLSQEFENFEVIVLDDGSPDTCWQVANEIKDTRLVLVQHPNRGLAATLNRGIELAKGRYIARQDQDDLLLSGRLAKQLAFLETHPDVAMVGTWAQIYADEIPTDRFHKHDCSNEAIRFLLLFDNPFVHSSMMIRTDVLREVGGYSEDKSRQPPEDYELWSRIARRYRVANLPEVLTIYREMPGSMSRTGNNPFLQNIIRVSSENLLAELEPMYSSKQCLELAKLYHGIYTDHTILNRVLARKMLEVAAHKIGGQKSDRSAEFQASFLRLNRYIDSRFWQQLIPAPLLMPIRWLKDRYL